MFCDCVDSIGLNAGEFFKVVGCESVFRKSVYTMLRELVFALINLKFD